MSADGTEWETRGGNTESDALATGPGVDPCKFDQSIGGYDLWLVANEEGAYDDDCADAWNAMKLAGYIDELGIPTEAVTESPIEIWDCTRLQNEALKDELSGRGNLGDWFKVNSAASDRDGVPFEVHFYMNISTGELYLGEDYFLVFKEMF